MQFNRNILIPIVAVTIGCILGAAIATGVCWWEFARTSESHLQLEVFERVRILRKLRTSKNKEAIEEQEILLDGSVLGLG